VLLAAIAEVAVRAVNHLTYCSLGGARVCCFCSGCCWSL